jgi:hypothetical protein
VIVAKLAVMHAHEPTLTHDDLGRITCRALVMVADDDEVRLEHAVELYRSLPDAELAVAPGTSHGLLVKSLTCATCSSRSSLPRTRPDLRTDPQVRTLAVMNVAQALSDLWPAEPF